MNSPIYPDQPRPSQPEMATLDAPAAPPPELSPPTGYDRNRLKQIDQALNARMQEQRPTPTPHQIKIDL